MLYIIRKDMPKIMSSNITTGSNYSTLYNSLCSKKIQVKDSLKHFLLMASIRDEFSKTSLSEGDMGQGIQEWTK